MEKKEPSELSFEEEIDTALPEESIEEEPFDYDADIMEISEDFPEYELDTIKENPRYLELRELGLTPKEAFLATRPKEKNADNRSHLTGAIPKRAVAPSGQMSRRELETARSIFGELDDKELRRLYQRVTK